MNQSLIQSLIQSLRLNKNLIIQGAPGTGKTYVTRELAVAMCDPMYHAFARMSRADIKKSYDNLVNSGRVEFITFHQSLDYEEFIEGLKPDIDPNTLQGTGTFSVKDGIFKKICREAAAYNIANQFKQELADIKQLLANGGALSIPQYGANGTTKITSKFNFSPKGYDIKDVWESGITEERTFNIEEAREKYPDLCKQGTYSPFWALLNEIWNRIQLNSTYILIIDEINRANVSKVLGELITLIEPSKRLGEDDEYKVTLPYSGKKFGVPSNLYIIGTMNTADRSLGTIDYAIRRRFAFETLQSDDNIIDSNFKTLYDNVKKLISECHDDDFEVDDIMVGHSYFMGDNDNCLDKKIIPLLLEYFRDGILVDKDSIFKSNSAKAKCLKDYLKQNGSCNYIFK